MLQQQQQLYFTLTQKKITYYEIRQSKKGIGSQSNGS